MSSEPSIKRTGPDPRLLWPIGLFVIGVAYSVVFAATRDASLLDDLKAAALNCLSLALTAAAARAVMKRWLLPLKGWAMWAAHLALASAFAVVWAWLLYVVTGISEAGSATRFEVVPFLEGAAQQWQVLQGLFAYAALAALTAVEHRPAGGLLVLDNTAPEFRQRFLMRGDGAVLSLTAADIVSVIGADDYSEIVTAQGAHLVSTTLSELEAALDPRHFLRVHRSAIANLDHVQRAEPTGGGRMTLSMRAGPDLAVSRSGARLLRERLL